MDETKCMFDKTYMTEKTEEIGGRGEQQVMKVQKYTQEKMQSK